MLQWNIVLSLMKNGIAQWDLTFYFILFLEIGYIYITNDKHIFS